MNSMGWRFYRLALVGAILAGTGLIGCPASTRSPVFDLAKVEVGDSVLGLKVIKVEATPLGSYGTVGTVMFKGDITVSGTYVREPLSGTGADVPCFYVVDTSADELPQVKGDNRIPWFCFTNGAAAEAALGDRAGELTQIVIDQYTINYIPSDVNNEALFVRRADS